jgi:Fe-S oxidoreductase
LTPSENHLGANTTVSGDASGSVAAETVYATDKLASTLKVHKRHTITIHCHCHLHHNSNTITITTYGF